MKQYISYTLSCLLAIACCLSVQAQELRNAPGDIKMPYGITLEPLASKKGSFAVSGADTYGFAYKDKTITITLSPEDGYSISDNLIKVYGTYEPNKTVSLTTPADANAGNNTYTRTFAMPDYPVTVEVDYLSPLKEDMISLSSSSAIYNGTEQKPTVTVTDGATTLIVNTHYTLSWGDAETVWKDAGTYTVTVTPKNDGGYGGDAVSTTFTITPATLTITPDAGQVVYEDEATYAPSYKVSGLVQGDEHIITGSLQVNSDGKIVDKDLKANGNYTITVEERFVAKQTGNAGEAVATLQDTPDGENGWYNGTKTTVTLKAPAGFKMKQTDAPTTPVASSAPSLRNTSATNEYAASLTFTEEGEHAIHYELKRDVMGTEYTGKQPITYKLDACLPTATVSTDKLAVTVALKDAVSGVASCTYTWDNGAEQTPTITPGATEATFSFNGEAGTHHLAMTVKDMAGNILTIPSTEVVLQKDGSTTPIVPPSDPDPSDPSDPNDPSDPSDPNDPSNPSDPSDPSDPNDPVANETVSSDPSVATLAMLRHAFSLTTARPSVLYLFTIDGQLQRSLPLLPGVTRIDGLPAGIYILCLSSGEKWKGMIR